MKTRLGCGYSATNSGQIQIAIVVIVAATVLVAEWQGASAGVTNVLLIKGAAEVEGGHSSISQHTKVLSYISHGAPWRITVVSFLTTAIANF
jgi:hypothetical protein